LHKRGFQFFFWMIMTACFGFTFGSAVNRDLVGLTWNLLGDIIIVTEFALVFALFVLNCFADKSPAYMDIKGIKMTQIPRQRQKVAYCA
jgi:hypothetical protein